MMFEFLRQKLMVKNNQIELFKSERALTALELFFFSPQDVGCERDCFLVQGVVGAESALALPTSSL